MKNIDYKGYTITLEKQYNGSYLTYIYDDFDWLFKRVYSFYSQFEIIKMLKEVINNKEFDHFHSIDQMIKEGN